MTGPQLNVEYEQLIARAAELEEAMPTIPADNPRGTCDLPMTRNAADQLRLSADNMRLYLKTAEREWNRLAESLRNAAKAYEEVDEDAADAMGGGGDSGGDTGSATAGGAGVEPVTPVPLEVVDTSGLGPTAQSAGDEYFDFPTPETPDDFNRGPEDYYEVRQAALAIEAPDQGAEFEAFAQQWDDFQLVFQRVADKFRPFDSWEGDARDQVEGDFEAHRGWVYQMANLCQTLGGQARAVNGAHRWAIKEHPTAYRVFELDHIFANWTLPRNINKPGMRAQISSLLRTYDDVQQQSEDVLAEYRTRGSMPLNTVRRASLTLSA